VARILYAAPVPVPAPAVVLNLKEFIKGLTIGIYLSSFLKDLLSVFGGTFF